MAERFGNVLYWLGCIVAALTAGIGIFSYGLGAALRLMTVTGRGAR
jgi:hypothetical protein